MRFRLSCLSWAFGVVALLSLVSPPCVAEDKPASDIHISQPYSWQPPKSAEVMAGYLTITNDGPDDVLVAATSSIAKRAVVHLMSITNGVMKMGDVGAGIAIPHGQTVELKPMSSHIMFMGLTSEPAKGTSFDGTLTFAKAGSLKVSFKVLGTGQRP